MDRYFHYQGLLGQLVRFAILRDPAEWEKPPILSPADEIERLKALEGMLDRPAWLEELPALALHFWRNHVEPLEMELGISPEAARGGFRKMVEGRRSFLEQ